MISNDINNREAARVAMQQAIAANDTEAFYTAFDQMLGVIEQGIRADYEQDLANLRADQDSAALSSRGVRQLTNEEKTFYQAFADAAKSSNPRQALTDAHLLLPETVINAVFEELQTAHPLLSRINFVPSGGAVQLLINTNGYQQAAWGELCDEIVTELTGGFKTVDTTLLKLSAFLPVCKAMLDLGPAWLDRYVRETLYEALANGLESGIVAGTGNKQPIGMTRQVGDGVSVTGGVYPEKSKIAVTSFDTVTVGDLLKRVSKNGTRRADNILLIVNPADYYTKVMPATTLMAPDGSYRSDVMPYPMSVIPCPAVPEGSAVFGLGKRYLATAGTATQGRIEYSDHYKFLEDQRVYLIKAYANGMPMDNDAFVYLNISNLKPAAYKVEMVGAAE